MLVRRQSILVVLPSSALVLSAVCSFDCVVARGVDAFTRAFNNNKSKTYCGR